MTTKEAPETLDLWHEKTTDEMVVMEKETEKSLPIQELDEEDQDFIRAVFHEEIAPKLAQLDARLGNVNCAFAGEAYKNWAVQFRSVGSDFEIVDFEWDEGGDALDLDL